MWWIPIALAALAPVASTVGVIVSSEIEKMYRSRR